MVDLPKFTQDSSDNTINNKYGLFRTPVFEISVGGPNGDNMIKLPEQLKRLIEKIEIQETIGQPVSCLYSQIVITFIEGSREPYEHTSANTNQLYPIDNVGNIFISNKTGMLPDLELKNQGGLLNISSAVAALVSVSSVLNLAKSAFGSTIGFVSGDNTVDIDDDSIPTKEQWLFKEGNQVKVTFGYLEDPSGQRSVRGKIKVIQTDFPETGHPKTTITCFGPEADADRLTTPRGIQFATKYPNGLSLKGSPTFAHKDQSIIDILNQICKLHGIEVIISKKFLAEFTDKHFAKKWPAGESFHQFLGKLAARHNAYYNFIIDPKTGKDIIYFISRPDYDKYLIFSDPNLFAYRQPGSILKSISIKADFNGITGTYTAGVNDDGKMIGKGTVTPQEEIATFTGSVLVNTKPVGAVSDAINGASTAGKSTGKMEVSPEANSEGNIEDKALSKTACSFSHLIGIEFTSLGYPKLVPGPLLITGLGKRYSGSYKLINITHILDENGYVCKGIGQGEALGAGGLKDPSTVETKSNTKQNSDIVSMFSTVQAITGTGEPRQTLDSKRNQK